MLLIPIVNTSATQVVNPYLSCRICPHKSACDQQRLKYECRFTSVSFLYDGSNLQHRGRMSSWKLQCLTYNSCLLQRVPQSPLTITKSILMYSKRLPLLRIGVCYLPEGWSLLRAVVVISSDYLSAAGPDNFFHRSYHDLWKYGCLYHISTAFFCNERVWSSDATITKNWAADTLRDTCCSKTLKKPQTPRQTEIRFARMEGGKCQFDAWG